METHFRQSGNAMDRRPPGTGRQAFSSTAMQDLNIRDRFELESPCSSHGDNRYKVKNHVSRSETSGYHSKQQTRRVNAADNDELVKYMSDLPSYVERGMKQQEKAFNFGVLDWSLLEKWQSSKQVPYRGDGSSSSNSNSFPLFPTEESSPYSQTSQGNSVTHHRHQHSAHHLKLKGISSEALEGKSSYNFYRNQIKLPEDSGTKEGLGSTTAFSKNGYVDGHNLSSSSKVQGHDNSEMETRRPRRSQSMSLSYKSTEKNEKAVHARHHDDGFIAFKSKGCKVGTSQRLTEDNGDTDYYELTNEIPRSFRLPCDENNLNIKAERSFRSQDAKTNDCASAGGSQSLLLSAGKLSGADKEGRSEDNHTSLMAAITTVTDLPHGSRISKCTADAAKARYSSPSGRFSFGIGRLTRKTSSFDDAELIRSCPAYVKPCNMREIHSRSLENSNRDKPAAAGKARSSPLKRLLDPLLKHREGNNSFSSKVLDSDSKSVNRISKTLDKPYTAPVIEAGFSLSSGKSTSIHNAHYNERNKELEVVEALLQVVVKNGCPLFTFAVDSVKEILCATLSKLSTKKEFEDRYLYTIFSVHELKNKSWTNLRGKGSHKYSPDVVAQIEVSETKLFNTVDYQSLGKTIVREFVLSSVELMHGEKANSQYQLNDELAAVVVGIPGETDDKQQTGKFNGTTTIILPGGIHTVPSKDKPSSLIERWRSGGQCDCGGWDSGCKLKILTDSKCSSGSLQYQLVEQGGAEEKQPVFILSPYKDKEGVLSVSFSSSISPLQAFSICLAVLDTKKHPGPLTIFNSHEADETRSVKGHGGYVSVPPHSPVGRA